MLLISPSEVANMYLYLSKRFMLEHKEYFNISVMYALNMLIANMFLGQTDRNSQAGACGKFSSYSHRECGLFHRQNVTSGFT